MVKRYINKERANSLICLIIENSKTDLERKLKEFGG